MKTLIISTNEFTPDNAKEVCASWNVTNLAHNVIRTPNELGFYIQEANRSKDESVGDDAEDVYAVAIHPELFTDPRVLEHIATLPDNLDTFTNLLIIDDGRDILNIDRRPNGMRITVIFVPYITRLEDHKSYIHDKMGENVHIVPMVTQHVDIDDVYDIAHRCKRSVFENKEIKDIVFLVRSKDNPLENGKAFKSVMNQNASFNDGKIRTFHFDPTVSEIDEL